MNGASLREIARALGGDVVGAQVLAPGPNHDKRDRSLSVKISASSPDGFICHSFAGDAFQECRDYVKARLGIASTRQLPTCSNQPANLPVDADGQRVRVARASAIWLESRDPRGTLVATYLNGRALDLHNDIANSVVRFHPECPWKLEDGSIIRVPAMVCSMRSIVTDEITAIHRTRLSPTGEKIDRRMMGVAAGSAIKLDADEVVGGGLHIAEGIESALAARQLGLRPTWALGSTSFVAAFPVVSGIECLTILAENDAASGRATAACAARWNDAGRIVLMNRPTRGKDLNDAIRGAA